MIVFGHLDAWHVDESPPRHDTAYPASFILFDDEEAPEEIQRAHQYWPRVQRSMALELLYLRTGRRR